MLPTDLPADILQRAARIKLAVFDVDGVLTDGRLWYAADGSELKAFHAHDGAGMKRLAAAGIEIAVITARSSHVVSVRMAELGIVHVYQGRADKLACFEHLLKALQLEPADACYTGDDVVDLAPMQRAGLSIAPANAHPYVREHAAWRTRQAGGNGAAREVCDLLLAAQGKLGLP
ncbi:MAG: HAD hydrolase family protein [Proteobacteria bacterium]|uniref:KdsC family phosphatase n=1 Tax=Rudaea sp. TaxID=2136325 RepID=UPI001D604397|nr:HAD hydrolase family protein [Pseudomonadota bacterium]MBS0567699.1 HAD hydrolase family protein [Pseudomonadota bacterium]